MGAPPTPVDQVREQLRQLGYLDSGLDRFVLAGAGPVSPLAASRRAAVRVGIAGGVLVGLALTFGAAALDPRLRAVPADLVVLALYLILLATLALGVTAFLAGLLVARLGRAPGANLARNVGLGLALLALSYLALWWRSHATTAPGAVQVIAALVALGLALALARFGSLAAVAVLSAGGAAGNLPRATLSRRHVLALLAASVLLFAGALTGLSYAGARRAAELPDFAVIPTGVRVRVVAVDGLSWSLAERSMASGAMPRLHSLYGRSARARLRAEPEAVPALVWTTVATGRGPEAHGIVSTGARRLAGMRTPVELDESSRLGRAVASAADVLRLTRRQPASSALRTVKTFWNVASEKGLRVGVVNWWASWPADAVNGYVVSDRAFLKLERGDAPDRETHPPEVFETLRPLLGAAPEVPEELRRASAIDAFHAAAATRLRAERAPDLDVVYLPGLDIATMQLLGASDTIDVAALSSRVAAVDAYCRWLDVLIGGLADATPPEQALLLVGDPGRRARGLGSEPTGILLLAGAVFVPGDAGTVSERDIAPTVARLVGLPASLELQGASLERVLTGDFRARHALRQVPAWGNRAPSQAADSAFDREVLEELRSLGYIQ